MANETDMAYRRATVHGASGVGLLIAVFDTLAGNLRRAGDAMRRDDIESRCREFSHALLVLGHLESWIDLENGGESARNLAVFYEHLRAQIMLAQGKQSVQVVEQQMQLVLDVRQAWQQAELCAYAATPLLQTGSASLKGLYDTMGESATSEWSA